MIVSKLARDLARLDMKKILALRLWFLQPDVSFVCPVVEERFHRMKRGLG